MGFYRAPDGPEIAAETYDMGSADDAYGVLSIDKTGERVGAGSTARYGAGLLRLCKGRRFVRVLAERETEGARAAVLELDARLAAQVAADSRPPNMLRALPSEGLEPDSAAYFHGEKCGKLA